MKYEDYIADREARDPEFRAERARLAQEDGMMHSDADIRAAHQREQSHAGIRDMAGDIAAFHRGLTEAGLPRKLAGDLTRMFTMATLSACDDECDGCGVG